MRQTKRYLITIVALLMMAMGFAIRAQEDTRVIGGNESQLRNFIARYLGNFGDETVQILIGQQPTDLPVSVLLPDGVTTLASIVRSNVMMGPGVTSSGTYVEILLDNVASPQAVHEFYTQVLPDNNWREIQAEYTAPSGFSDSASAYGNFCFGDDNTASLNYDAYTDGSDRVQSTIRIQFPADVYNCSQQEFPPYNDPIRLIPDFTTPADTTISSTDGGQGYYGRNAVMTMADITSRLSLSDLFAHYNGELMSKGTWESLGETMSDTTSSSQWRVVGDSGELYSGTFIIIQSVSDENAYKAYVFIEPDTN